MKCRQRWQWYRTGLTCIPADRSARKGPTLPQKAQEGWGNPVRSTDSERMSQAPLAERGLVSCVLFLGTRLGRHKACEAVVHNELAVVFTAMFDDAVCYVENARFLAGEINDLGHQAFFAL